MGPGLWFCAPGSQVSEFPGESLVSPEMLRRTQSKHAKGSPVDQRKRTLLHRQTSLCTRPGDMNYPLLWGIYVPGTLHAIGLRELLLQGLGGHI